MPTSTSFIGFDQTNMQINIYTTDSIFVKDYTFEVRARFNIPINYEQKSIINVKILHECVRNIISSYPFKD